ncbi:MAG: sigma 54-interacting transcriptional regulator [Firmicutes bacterium]|nr:sigma 54-interacting transcriptional regulator [Bacillota bacterium]MCL5039604.1 sigma 54-interacting transcriptional regulator [Bacillota bacterium]
MSLRRGPLLQELLETRFTPLRYGDTLGQAVSIFRHNKVDFIPVVDEEEKLLSALTRSCLYDALLRGAHLQDPIDPYLLKDVFTLPANLPFETLIEMVKKSPVGTAPVLDAKGRVVGLLTKSNMVMALIRRLDALATQLQAFLYSVQDGMANVEEPERVARINSVNNGGIDDIITVNPLMKRIKEEIVQVARGGSTVLITGESGTGKGLVASAIHESSPRRGHKFIKINCSAIPEQLLEAELFGYAPGAFTDALRTGKPGRLEKAHQGTVFLDEIGDMSPLLQAKLLRVLEEKEFERVGSLETIKVDIRIIAATNQDLGKAVEEGLFRKDLYYRLNVINLHLPPLRERLEDIEPLVLNFIEKYNQVLDTHVRGISQEALMALKGHHWPGNVRELENVIERALNYVRRGLIRVEHLPPYLLKAATYSGTTAPENTFRFEMGLRERELILSALARTNGNKSEAARLLNLSRSHLYEKMKRLGIPGGRGET